MGLLCVPVSVYGTESAPTTAPRTADVPIIMYHLVTQSSKYIGKFGITPADLESDLKYLKDNGYTTVVIQDLIDFVNNGKDLPEKPVMLTFDDGNGSDYHYLYPLLKKYDMKAVLCIMGKQSDDYTVLAQKQEGRFPNLTWEQINEMRNSGHVEIQSHGYDVHGPIGSSKKKGEPSEIYHTRLKADLSKMQERTTEMTSYTPTAFAYPLGMISEGSREVLVELGIVASLSCRDGMSHVVEGEKETLFRLNRENRPSGRPVWDIIAKMRKTQ